MKNSHELSRNHQPDWLRDLVLHVTAELKPPILKLWFAYIVSGKRQVAKQCKTLVLQKVWPYLCQPLLCSSHGSWLAHFPQHV